MTKRLQEAIYAANLLREARTILSNPDVWTKDGLWYNEGGDHGNTMTAPKVCAIGGVCRAAKIAITDTEEALHIPDIQEALERLASCAPIPAVPVHSDLTPIYAYNDGDATHEDILALFDLVIEEQCKIVRNEAAKVPDADQ